MYGVNDDKLPDLGTKVTVKPLGKRSNTRVAVITVILAALISLAIALAATFFMIESSQVLKVSSGSALQSSESGETVMAASAETAVLNGTLVPRSSATISIQNQLSPLAVSTSEHLIEAPLASTLPDGYFQELRFIKFVQPNGATLSLRVEGIMRVTDPTALCGSTLSIFTGSAGVVEIDGRNLLFTSANAADMFAQAGFSTPSRRLSTGVELYGLFNRVVEYNLECPDGIHNPSFPSAVMMKSHKYEPCYETASQQTGSRVPCTEHGSVRLPVVKINGQPHLYIETLVVKKDDVHLDIFPDATKAHVVRVAARNATHNIDYTLKHGLPTACRAVEADVVTDFLSSLTTIVQSAHVGREELGGQLVDHFLLTADVPEEVLEAANATTTEMEIRIRYYQSVGNEFPMRIVTDTGMFIDYTGHVTDTGIINQVLSSYAFPNCDEFNQYLTHELLFADDPAVVGATLNFLGDNSTLEDLEDNSFEVNSAPTVGIIDNTGDVPHVNTGGPKYSRWFFRDSNGQDTLCVSHSHVGPEVGKLTLAPCGPNPAQRFHWRGLRLYHFDSDRCLALGQNNELVLAGCSNDESDVWLDSTTSTMGFFSHVGYFDYDEDRDILILTASSPVKETGIRLFETHQMHPDATFRRLSAPVYDDFARRRLFIEICDSKFQFPKGCEEEECNLYLCLKYLTNAPEVSISGKLGKIYEVITIGAGGSIGVVDGNPTGSIWFSASVGVDVGPIDITLAEIKATITAWLRDYYLCDYSQSPSCYTVSSYAISGSISASVTMVKGEISVTYTPYTDSTGNNVIWTPGSEWAWAFTVYYYDFWCLFCSGWRTWHSWNL